ncbi:MAG: Si-specific NAD(P)(+) transhydrogenase [Rhodospirillaceae bacterium]|jgi:NAD(P) transhydrogenase|nr:Si-specific NAD(P)(+) transhydrogenase [Rhodospirillaceae bacterium]MBT3493557.1 Si-specific NAD(P)(+) transhydrogenase [Rhodospirillaceae bacterium]MBT3779286.1 Si-specific NAD(P)(+) transhydrogenase [Rhodospirillaceae bacterium]MBT3976896.1 Si-specific NAD(P)(+) transhydrogenase [Rhodospirillaceae bacterium]MBT4169034.1 Si-specific NAD(P)(+) transhydrogenase [Rhodospirillaceae bacterium]
MAKYDYDMISIGSGPAGQRAAVQGAKLGKRVAIIEREQVVGGVSLHTGTIPSKTFREAVLTFGRGGRRASDMRRRASDSNGNGFKAVTAGQLFERVGNIVQREEQVQDAQLGRNDVDVIVGTAKFKDPHELLITSSQGERTASAKNIMIAVGTRPATPPDTQLDGERIITSDEIFNLDELPHSMVVIGCGVVGIEYASMFALLGVEVTVVDGRGTPLEFLDREIVDELVHQMRAINVVFRLGETVERVETRDAARGRVVVSLESGKRLVADVALVCAGRAGNTHSLNLQAAKLTPDERGRLTVDDTYRTKQKHIFAGGDVIGFPALAATSSEQGRLAACNAFGVKVGPMPTNFPVGIYSIPEISMVGETEHELTAKKIPYEVGVARFREIARGQILGDDTGMLKLIFHREDHSLLGVHTIGTGATELVHIGQCVMGLNGGLSYFLETVFNYPTLAECYKVAALDANNKLNL